MDDEGRGRHNPKQQTEDKSSDSATGNEAHSKAVMNPIRLNKQMIFYHISRISSSLKGIEENTSSWILLLGFNLIITDL